MRERVEVESATKSQIKTILEKFKVTPEILKTCAANRSGWRTNCVSADTDVINKF